MSQKNVSGDSPSAGAKLSEDAVVSTLRDFGQSDTFVDAVIKSTCGGPANNAYYVELAGDGKYQVWPEDEIEQQEMRGTFVPIPTLSEAHWQEADEPGNTLAKVITRHRNGLLDQMLSTAKSRLGNLAGF